MTFINNIFSPLSISFAVIILGYFLGRVKILGVSFDIAGVLIVAVIVGWILNATEPIKEYLTVFDFHTNMKFFSSLGSALFVSIIGITTGYSLDIKRWQDIKAALIGSLMVASAFLTMKIISVSDTDISVSKLLGVLCGALTTTPGLSAACELNGIMVADTMLGYGCTYLLGVIFTVLSVQIVVKKSSIKPVDKVCDEKTNPTKCAFDGLVQIGIVVLLGRMFGNIKIFDFCLGNSGGTLCAGIVTGQIIKNWLSQRMAQQKSLNLLRSFGLILFFVGNGIPSGMQLGSNFDIKMVPYGVLMTIIPILVGTLLYKIMFSDGLGGTVIAGGMTSTPAIGVLIQKNINVNLARYSLAYVGALLTIIVLIQASSLN